MKDVRILLVDDNPDDQFLIMRVLSKCGFRNVILTNDGNEALEYLRSETINNRKSPDFPDIILLDTRMPTMDGFQFLEIYQQHKPIWDVPVLMLPSGKDGPLGLAKGAAAFLAKPVGAAELSETINRLIERYNHEESEDKPTEGIDGSINEFSEDVVIALAYFGDKIKPVELHRDGSYQFLDATQKKFDSIFVVSPERLALGDAIDELESLINNPKLKESDLQNFFDKHPDFILNDDYKKAHGHIVLERENGGSLIPDFVLEPSTGSPLCDILELKLPNVNIFKLQKNRNRYSSSVFEACAQLREYSRYFEEECHRKQIHKKFGLQFYKPRCFVIIGRRGDVDPIQMRAIESDNPHVTVKTYDDVIIRMKHKLDRYLKS